MLSGRRGHARGKRWLLLRRWKTVRGSKRRELEELFTANRRLFKAYVLREHLDRLWTYKTPQGVGNCLLGWLKARRWQRLPEMERRGEFRVKPLEGIAAYCFHPVRFGVVESLTTTIKAVIRRARGMRDEPVRLLTLKWATAHPIRAARDLKRFLQPYELHSNRSVCREKEYRFKNFREALDFTIRVGELAEEQRHHPDIHLAWGKVRLAVWTHKIDGLTESDFVFAAKADRQVQAASGT